MFILNLPGIKNKNVVQRLLISYERDAVPHFTLTNRGKLVQKGLQFW